MESFKDFCNNNKLAVDFDDIDTSSQLERQFTDMMEIINCNLDVYFPKRNITISNHDPNFVTPLIKAMLRKRNKLMRSSKIEKAVKITESVRKKIIQQNTAKLNNVNTRKGKQDAWKMIREYTNCDRHYEKDWEIEGVTADLFNKHYAYLAK